jgi:hypothetical protein
LDPTAFPEGGFAVVEVTADGVPIAIVGNNVWRFDGAAWQSVPAIPSEYSHKRTLPEFAIARNGAIFVAVESAAGTAVLRLADSGWSEVGGGPVPVSDKTAGASLTATPNGKPIVAVRDVNISVFEFLVSEWVQFGDPISAEGAFTPIAVAAPGDGRPFIAYATMAANVTALALLKFNDVEWIGTGSIQLPGFTPQDTTVLAADYLAPYATVAFHDSAMNVDRRAVVKWNGTAWLPLGVDGYRTGTESPGVETKLAVSETGVPFVLYQTATGFTVKRFQ